MDLTFSGPSGITANLFILKKTVSSGEGGHPLAVRFLLIEYIFNSVLKPLTNYFSNVIIMFLTKKNLRTFPIIIYIYLNTYNIPLIFKAL